MIQRTRPTSVLRASFWSAAAIAASAVVSPASLFAQDHAFHHPEGAALALRCPDMAAARKAWVGSPFMRFLEDERILTLVQDLSGVEDARPLDRLAAIWPGDYLEGVTALSISVTPVADSEGDRSLLGYLADLFPVWAEEYGSGQAVDPMERGHLRLVLDFESASAASAWSAVGHRIAERIDLEAVPEPVPPSRLEMLGFEEGVSPSYGRYKQRTGVDTIGIFSRITVGNRVLLTLGPDAPTSSGGAPSMNALSVFDNLSEPVLLDFMVGDAVSARLEGEAASMAPFIELGLGLADPLLAMIMDGGRRTVSMNGDMFSVRGSTARPSWELAHVLGLESLADGAVELVHPSAQVAHVTSMDAAAAGAWMQSLAVQADAVEFLEGFGLYPGRDVTAGFGDTLAIELWPIRGVTTAPDLFLMATLKDPAVVERMADAGQRMVADLAPRGVVVTKQGYRGALLYSLTLPTSGGVITSVVGFRPTVIIDGNVAALAMSVSSAKRWVRAHGKEHEAHAGLSSVAAPPEAGSISYGNWPAIFADAYGHALELSPLGELILGASDGEELRARIAELPEPSVIHEFFQPGWAWTRPEAGGAMYRSAETSCGPVGFMLLAGLGATVMGPKMFSRLGQAQAAVSEATLYSLRNMVMMHMLEESELPSSLEDLREGNPEWFAENGKLLDPWGQPFSYQPNDDFSFRLWSAGPNQIDEGGNGDDIVVDG